MEQIPVSSSCIMKWKRCMTTTKSCLSWTMDLTVPARSKQTDLTDRGVGKAVACHNKLITNREQAFKAEVSFSPTGDSTKKKETTRALKAAPDEDDDEE